jgi:hypothetical protein
MRLGVLLLLSCHLFTGLLVASPSGGTCPVAAPSDITTCYYVDFAGGSDSNSGASEGSPWKRAPGMTGTVNGVGPGAIDDAAGDGCPSICTLPNTGFIFKGGVTWTVATMKWTIRQQGTGPTARVYWGVDPLWYSGGSWARPIFNMGGSGGGYKCSPALQMAPSVYTVIDNFEWTNLYWDHTCNGSSNGSITYIDMNGSEEGLTNNYFHGWSHEAYSPNNTADGCDLVAGPETGATGSYAIGNVFDGSDTSYSSGLSCVAFWGSPDILHDNYITYVANGYVGEGQTSSGQVMQFYENTCDHIAFTATPDYDPTQHTQCFETNGDLGVVFYNNLIQNLNHAGIVVNISTNSGSVSYIWNNVIWNVSDGDNILVFSYPAAQFTGGTFYAFNNTIETGLDGGSQTSYAVGALSGQTGTYYQNNLFISSTNQALNCTAANCHYEANNLIETQSAANAQGYTSGSTYPFTPPSGGSTINAGQTLTSTSPGCGSSGLTTLCTDSTAGVGYNVTSHTVIIPNRAATVSRPASGAWDIGAYQYQSGAGTYMLIGEK